jgi:iron(III) transport system substrate-binding protein
VNSITSLLPKFGVLLALAVVLGVPLAFRPESARVPGDAARLVIITPHNEQIRYEFARGFDAWHREHFGQPAVIDWRQPGGTSEIRRVLESQYKDALRTGRILPDGTMRPGAEPMPYDLIFGGGTFEHIQVKTGVRFKPPDAEKEITLPMSMPMGFEQPRLDEWYGKNLIGALPLYDPGDPAKNDPGQFWLGNAVSGFGIIFNRDALKQLNLPEPVKWEDMCAPTLQGWIALADPRQSGSVATTYESILNAYGWDQGWSILRRMCANGRYFTASSLKVPLDVSQGQAAMGVAIDFYGRYQSQAMLRPGQKPEESRVGYVDPPGVALIDPDPISMLRGGPHPETARRFVEYILSEEGQAVWNFPARSAGASDELGPERFEIRRMPIRRVMFEKHWERLVDKVNPYEIASTAKNRGWRSAVGPLMGAFGIDVHQELIAAWKAINSAKARGAPADLIAQAEALFYAFPEHTIPAKGDKPAQTLPLNEANYRAIREDWRDAEKDGRMATVRLGYASFFRERYARIVSMLE